MESKRFWISWLDFFAHFVSTTLRISNWTLQKRLGEWLCFSQGTNQCDHPKIFRRAGGTLHCSAFCLGGGGERHHSSILQLGEMAKNTLPDDKFFFEQKRELATYSCQSRFGCWHRFFVWWLSASASWKNMSCMGTVWCKKLNTFVWDIWMSDISNY